MAQQASDTSSTQAERRSRDAQELDGVLSGYPQIALDATASGPPRYAESPWISQLKTLPVLLGG
jgi:hypothetical protein